jgi:hypothetical protein
MELARQRDWAPSGRGGLPAARYTDVMAARPWPVLRDEDRWLADAMERRLLESTQSPEEMRARARELRAEAEQSDVKGIRDAKLALAERYEQAAATRLVA